MINHYLFSPIKGAVPVFIKPHVVGGLLGVVTPMSITIHDQPHCFSL